MEITLHLGAHRCASTTFQSYVRKHAPALSEQGVSFWGPLRTRKGLFNGLFPAPGEVNGAKQRKRARGRVRLRAAQARANGTKHLLVSDENMIGSTRQAIRARKLYPAIGERMARMSDAFDGQIDRLVLTVRGHDLWWASACAFAVGRGHSVPDPCALQRMVDTPRGWRDVITDLACAVPNAQIIVQPFETHMGRPDRSLAMATGIEAPRDTDGLWLNKAPDIARLRHLLHERGGDADQLPDQQGRWQPFTAAQLAQLQERYLDDLFWLEAGADGLATYQDDTTPKGSGTSLASGDFRRGHGYDGQAEQQSMAATR